MATVSVETVIDRFVTPGVVALCSAGAVAAGLPTAGLGAAVVGGLCFIGGGQLRGIVRNNFFAIMPKERRSFTENLYAAQYEQPPIDAAHLQAMVDASARFNSIDSVKLVILSKPFSPAEIRRDRAKAMPAQVDSVYKTVTGCMPVKSRLAIWAARAQTERLNPEELAIEIRKSMSDVDKKYCAVSDPAEIERAYFQVTGCKPTEEVVVAWRNKNLSARFNYSELVAAIAAAKPKKCTEAKNELKLDGEAKIDPPLTSSSSAVKAGPVILLAAAAIGAVLIARSR